MARVVLIGASGHIGTYLVPRLVQAGQVVVNVTCGQRAPYLPHAASQAVETVTADRKEEHGGGRFTAPDCGARTRRYRRRHPRATALGSPTYVATAYVRRGALVSIGPSAGLKA